jgi:hypothetical protein
MKIPNVLGLVVLFAVSLAIGYVAYSSPVPVPQQAQIISCSSDDMKRKFCAADVSGGVQLVKQRSDAPCVLDQTWGYSNDRGIWVDRGCRADFQLGDSDASGVDNRYSLYCASDNGRRNECPADTRGGVHITRKRSGAACDYGKSWGYNPKGIWVDRGCRADFQVGGRRGDGDDRYRDRDRDAGRDRDRDDDRDRDRDGRRDRDNGGGVQIVTCASDDMGHRDCRVETRGVVRLVRQRSDAECVFGRTWGYDRHSIWVDRGCRADFEVGDAR